MIKIASNNKKYNMRKLIKFLMTLMISISSNSQTTDDEFINYINNSTELTCSTTSKSIGKITVSYPNNLKKHFQDQINNYVAEDFNNEACDGVDSVLEIIYEVKHYSDRVLSIYKLEYDDYCETINNTRYIGINLYYSNDKIYNIDLNENSNYTKNQINLAINTLQSEDCDYNYEDSLKGLIIDRKSPRVFVIMGKICNTLIDFNIKNSILFLDPDEVSVNDSEKDNNHITYEEEKREEFIKKNPALESLIQTYLRSEVAVIQRVHTLIDEYHKSNYLGSTYSSTKTYNTLFYSSPALGVHTVTKYGEEGMVGPRDTTVLLFEVIQGNGWNGNAKQNFRRAGIEDLIKIVVYLTNKNSDYRGAVVRKFLEYQGYQIPEELSNATLAALFKFEISEYTGHIRLYTIVPIAPFRTTSTVNEFLESLGV